MFNWLPLEAGGAVATLCACASVAGRVCCVVSGLPPQPFKTTSEPPSLRRRD